MWLFIKDVCLPRICLAGFVIWKEENKVMHWITFIDWMLQVDELSQMYVTSGSFMHSNTPFMLEAYKMGEENHSCVGND